MAKNNSRPHGRTVWIPCMRRGVITAGTPHRWHYRRIYAAGPDAWDWWCGHCGRWYTEVTEVPDEVARKAKRLGA